jgi:hypothetical protein
MIHGSKHRKNLIQHGCTSLFTAAKHDGGIYESSNPVFELIAYTSLLLSVLDLLYVGSCDASKGTRKDIGLHALTIAQCSMGSCSELGW